MMRLIRGNDNSFEARLNQAALEGYSKIVSYHHTGIVFEDNEIQISHSAIVARPSSRPLSGRDIVTG